MKEGGRGKALLSGFVSLLGVAALLPAAWEASSLTAPQPTWLVLDRNARFLAQLPSPTPKGFGYWPIDELPPRVVAATLAIEDRRFWTHPGVDPLAVLRAAWQNLRAGRRVSGASTIAMQIARMQRPGPRNYLRKAGEAFAALLMTLRHGRTRVLEHYLRLVPYGNRAHGITYAARLYLDKPVADLSWAEIAFLCAIPQAPGRMNPLTTEGRAHAIRRGERILNALRAQGVLGSADWELARSQIPALRVRQDWRRPRPALHAILRLGEMLAAAPPARAAGAQPFLIRSTLDLDLQSYVHRQAAQALARWSRRGAKNLSLVAVERENLEVVAWLGSSAYGDLHRAGAIDYARIERPAGSTLKPFVYALAMDRGDITPATPLHDRSYLAGGIRNADLSFLGNLLPRQALANSRNVPAAELLRTVGIDEGYFLLGSLGLHRAERPARHYGLGLIVGALPTTLERLVIAYAALARDGMLEDPMWYPGQRRRAPVRVLSAGSARLVTLFLADPLARLPSFPRMGTTEYPFAVAIKTGTSQGYRDAWTLAFSPSYLIGVWVGRSDNRSMDRLGGAESAAELAQRVLLHLHRDWRSGLADLPFPPPPGYASLRLCADTGRPDDGRCENTLREWLPAPLAAVLRGREAAPASSWSSTTEQPKNRLAVTESNREAEDRSNPVRLRIRSPQDGLRVLRNPSIPQARNTLALDVEVPERVAQMVWYVDDQPFRTVARGTVARWPLAPGTHRFQVGLPYRPEVSAVVTVTVE
jgi:penicillin-binding protein 1C